MVLDMKEVDKVLPELTKNEEQMKELEEDIQQSQDNHL